MSETERVRVKRVRQRWRERGRKGFIYRERVMHLFMYREREGPTELKIREARKRKRFE